VAFAAYYRATILSDETDPSKLYDLAAALDGRQVYDQAQGTNSALFLHVARPD
jgi:type I restriction enzyme R subunit